MTPTLSTPRLRLLPYYAGSVTDDHVRWLNDPEVVRYSEQRHKRHTLESVHGYVNDVASSPHSHIWGISIPAYVGREETFPYWIGTITAHIDRPNGIANVGILVGEKSEWGKGYGLEAWLAVCNWLFDQGIRKIEMGCHYKNRAMRKLAEKSGMTLEAVRHDHFIVDGEPQHLMLYAKMRPSTAKVTVDESSTA